MRQATISSILATALLAMPVMLSARASSLDAGNWQTYVNTKYQFSLNIPEAIFIPDPKAAASEAGRVWVSRDGLARLVASAGNNDSGETPASYRAFVMQRSYVDATVTYAPVRSRWFVLSGVKDDKMFYERITFVCQGGLIYGWQMTYPNEQRHIYDPIVEAIHKSYRPANRDAGRCPRS